MGDRTLTVGVLTPHVTAGPEIEIPVMSAGHVATVVSRIPLPARSDAGATSPQSLREGARPSALDGAAKAFPHGSVDALAYASTSSGYVTGVPDDGPVSWTAREDAAAAAAAILASNGAYEGPTTITADEAPTSWPTWISSACAATRDFTSASLASARTNSARVWAVSARSIDHTLASLTASSSAWT